MRQQNELRPYQQRIATHLYEHDEALCVVRPGGGKTISTLTAIRELIDDKVIRHALIVAPKRVAQEVWPTEICDWAHTCGLIYTPLFGKPEDRKRRLMLSDQITIIGLDLIDWLLEQLEDYPDNHPMFDLLVIDEISKLRDPTGVRAKLLAKASGRWKMVWGLSGTLRPNSALDLFMPARVVTRGKLWGKSYYQWRKRFFYPVDYHGYEWTAFSGSEEFLNAEIAPLAVTLREDEMPQLPELSVIVDRVQLPDKARRTYNDMHQKLIAKLEGKNVLAANTAVATGKLAQIANGFIYDGEGIMVGPQVHAVHDEKREWLLDLAQQATGPTLLIYEYQQDLAMLREIFGAALPCIGGDTGDVTAALNIELWNEGKFKFMALHPRSGGHGLNLQLGGCDMAWIAPTWSPELWEQTIARLHRSGQTRPVIVRVCVATGTVDDMKLDRVYGKMDAQKAFERYLAAQQEGIS